jgi:5-methylcytosine-specific restriction endonuclease McrA
MDNKYTNDKKIVGLFLAGKIQADIAKELDLSRTRIGQILNRNGYSGRNYRWIPNKEKLLNVLAETDSLTNAAKILNISELKLQTAVKYHEATDAFLKAKDRWKSDKRDERVLLGKRPLIIQIRILSQKIGHTPRQFELQKGGISSMTLVRYFGSISQAILESGLTPNKQHIVSPLPDDFLEISEPTENLDELDRRADLLRRLFEKIPEPTGEVRPKQVKTSSNVYIRDPKVVAWVLQYSNGFCEICGTQGYETDSKIAFLEIHHVVPLVEGGPDTIWNAIAVCETCHGKLHRWINREQMQINLYALIPRLHI